MSDIAQYIRSKFQSLDVIGLRMASGEELLATFEELPHMSNALVISKVRHVLVHNGPTGISLSLMPWSFCNVDASNIINIEQIVAILNPDDEMESNYRSQTSSIQLLS